MTPEFLAFSNAACSALLSKQQRAIETWNIGSADRWSADLEQGTLTFHFGDETITGAAEFLGSYSKTTGTWLWGWANESVPPNVKGAAEQVRSIGEADERLGALAVPRLMVPEEWGDQLASIVVEVAGLSGLYRMPSETMNAYLGFTSFTRSGQAAT